jgi:hypothetical protein
MMELAGIMVKCVPMKLAASPTPSVMMEIGVQLILATQLQTHVIHLKISQPHVVLLAANCLTVTPMGPVMIYVTIERLAQLILVLMDSAKMISSQVCRIVDLYNDVCA